METWGMGCQCGEEAYRMTEGRGSLRVYPDAALVLLSR